MNQFSFDSLLQQRIGFGKSQLIQVIVICFIGFLGGAEFLYIQLLPPLLKNQWNISVFELSAFTGFFNLGIAIGTSICGLFADHIGRKQILVISCFFQFLTVLCTIYAQNMFQMIFLRAFYGFVIGLILPTSQILITEITPPQTRGKIVIILQFTMALGRHWKFLLGFIFMESLSDGNWRAMAFCNTIPCLICFICAFKLIKESPRFQICQGKLNEGVNSLNEMGKTNNSQYINLQSDEINQLDEWRIHTYQEIKPEFLQLFNSINLKVTWRNYCIAFLFLFNLVANLAIMTFLLEAESKSLFIFWVIELFDFPGIIILMTGIDNIGRKNLHMISTVLNMISQFLLYQIRLSVIIVGLMIFKLLTIIGLSTSYILFAESYNTLHRSLGLGSSMTIGRIGGTLSPFIIYPIFYIDYYLPFLLTSIIFMIILIIVMFYPVDLTNKPLDHKEIKEQ